jgi:ATP-dependent Clp protease ATP-binding subunit ClpC
MNAFRQYFFFNAAFLAFTSQVLLLKTTDVTALLSSIKSSKYGHPLPQETRQQRLHHKNSLRRSSYQLLFVPSYRSSTMSPTKRMVFERMSEECIGAIVTAQKQAQKFSQPHVELPFLVAGVVDLPETPAMERTLKQYGVTWRKTLRALEEAYPDAKGQQSSTLGSFFQARNPDDDLPFAKDVQKALKGAGKIADAMGSTTVQTQHLFLSMLEYQEGNPPKAVTDSSENGAYFVLTRIDPSIDALDMCQSLLGHMQKSQDKERDLVTGVGSTAGTKTLDEVGVDLTALAQDGLLDVVQGRDKEIESCIRTLIRRRKNNPCLVGDAGVGKTAIVEVCTVRRVLVVSSQMNFSCAPHTTFVELHHRF